MSEKLSKLLERIAASYKQDTRCTFIAKRARDLERQLAEAKQSLVEADEKIVIYRDATRDLRQAAIDAEAENEALRQKVSDAEWLEAEDGCELYKHPETDWYVKQYFEKIGSGSTQWEALRAAREALDSQPDTEHADGVESEAKGREA